MGNNSLNADPHAKIFVTLEKSIHYAGEMVRGSVHLICKEDRPQYRYICLVIDGREETKWEEKDFHKHHNTVNNRITFIGRRNSYHGELTLAELKEGLRIGHYSYKFAFLLPGNMPASYFNDSTSFFNNSPQSIKYYLSGCLLSGQDIQSFAGF